MNETPTRETIHFVTGRLAEFSLRKVLESLSDQIGFDYTIDVLKITVAALMSPEWIAARIDVPAGTDRVVVPGYCEGDLASIQEAAKVPVECGPRDLRRLPEFFGKGASDEAEYGGYDIEILAEINNAPRWQLKDLLAEANRARADGANLIDVGCDPGGTWSGVAEVVSALKNEGHRVSIDSLNPREIEAAITAGAELVLSVNATNRQYAVDWSCEVVVIPDDFATLGGLDDTVQCLAEAGVPLRIDPIIEPIGFGFAKSLGRYLEVRRRYPDAEMMMGIGNLSELTDVDSAGVNVLLLGFCQELAIHSVLTTQVINWARTSVRECDIARRLVYHAVRQQVLPKHLDSQLVMLRDTETLRPDTDDIQRLAEQIKDTNYRILLDDESIHMVSGNTHIRGDDPFLMFQELLDSKVKNMDASHAFYLGYEMAKAVTAKTLDKEYRQDEALDWGFLTQPEESHRLRRSSAKPNTPSDPEKQA